MAWGLKKVKTPAERRDARMRLTIERYVASSGREYTKNVIREFSRQTVTTLEGKL